jgi:hypothetical protein
VINSGTHTIGEFRRIGGGALQPIGAVTGLAASDIGIVVR